MKEDTACGVYAITCSATGRQYIGSSRDVRRRMDNHLTALRQGGHYNKALQADFDRHGERAFTWAVVHRCAPTFLRTREQRFMVLAFRDEERLYNVREARLVNATSEAEVLAAVENF